MNAEQLIGSYVSDVVRRLPGPQRRDVAAELGALLREELADRSGATGGEPTEANALALLNGFGRPAEVAARYRPPITIIDPVDSRTFVNAAVGGVLLIWALGLVSTFQPAPSSIEDGVRAVQHFFFAIGLPAFMWPGFLVAWFAAAAWTRRRRPESANWKPRPAERDRVNRFGAASALVFYAVGTAILIAPAWALDLISGGRLSDPAREAFAYDSDFLRLRGPVVLAVLVAHLALLVATTVRGRWEPVTRRIQLWLNLVTVAVLAWVVVAGRTFQATATDQIFRLAMALTVLFVLLDVVLRVRRQRHRFAATAGPKLS
jgi:hypothetical protein